MGCLLFLLPRMVAFGRRKMRETRGLFVLPLPRITLRIGWVSVPPRRASISSPPCILALMEDCILAKISAILGFKMRMHLPVPALHGQGLFLLLTDSMSLRLSMERLYGRRKAAFMKLRSRLYRPPKHQRVQPFFQQALLLVSQLVCPRVIPQQYPLWFLLPVPRACHLH